MAKRIERKTIIGTERMTGSRNGNPRFRLVFSDGTTAATAPDASVAYGIQNREYRAGEVDVTFDGRGNVEYVEVVKGGVMMGVTQSDGIVTDLWCCVDCLVLFANGDAPGDWTEKRVRRWQRAIDRKTEGFHVTCGMMMEDHADDCENRTMEREIVDCDCETDTYSTSACDTCGSPLHGERHAVTMFPIDWRVTQ